MTMPTILEALKNFEQRFGVTLLTGPFGSFNVQFDSDDSLLRRILGAGWVDGRPFENSLTDSYRELSIFAWPSYQMRSYNQPYAPHPDHPDREMEGAICDPVAGWFVFQRNFIDATRCVIRLMPAGEAFFIRHKTFDPFITETIPRV